MTDHLVGALCALMVAIATAVVASIAARVRVLPEVIDVSVILTLAGLGALVFTTYGALRGYESDRIAGLTLGGTVVGGLGGAGLFLIALLVDVL